ncbi:MAG: J domain-containing protein [Cyanobacteriota bacterium]|nr:J domain-containing protein [Cyanobacteriota bacterium]
MGFDPRRWRSPPRSRPITANVEALLAENEALRREIWALRQQLEQQRSRGTTRVTSGSAPGLTLQEVERWCQAMARHPAWGSLRVGPPGGLRGLIEELRLQWWNPALSLEEELNRHNPGLGTELAAALRGPHSRGRWAVRAAFALYGPRAMEWLNEEPLRVVEELRLRVEQIEQRQGRGQRRGTRTENHSQAHQSSDAGQEKGQGARTRETPGGDPRREALRLLGLEEGASPQAIKRAYWRLAKTHHPDVGGDAEAFRQIDAAYRLLVN